ncbi:hypothetical protein GCM10028809_59550 [Spirosoma gilvum]
MDLFPEGFAAEGKIKHEHPIYRMVIQQTYRYAPALLISLGPSQAYHVRQLYQQPNLPTLLLPCGVFMHQERDPHLPPWRERANCIYIGYAGNVGQPHSADFLKSVINHFDPSRQQLILALYGQKADEIIRLATGRVGITLLKQIPRNQLHYLDLQLVTLLPQWTHIAVPSKAVSAICSGSPILFCGLPDSDCYGLLQEASFLISTTKPIDQQVAAFLTNLCTKQLKPRKEAAQLLAEQLQQLVKSTYNHLANELTDG